MGTEDLRRRSQFGAIKTHQNIPEEAKTKNNLAVRLAHDEAKVPNSFQDLTNIINRESYGIK